MADAESDSGDLRELAAVVRLRPIRTLVVSLDLAYRDRALTVLSVLGSVTFAVTSLDEPGDIVSLADGDRPDVVVLDATDAESAARRVIAALAQSAPRAGILVVCHHCTDAARELGALPKWGWTHDLREGVERAYREGNPLSPRALRALRRPPRQRAARPRFRR